MELQHITVIGAGEMGHGIAELAAVSGFDVTMQDIDETALTNGYEEIKWSVEKLEDDIDDPPETVLDRISSTTDLQAAVSSADAVIEAVPENVTLKQDLFKDLEAYTNDDVLLATNTSGIPITDIAQGMDSPERVVGMHFFNPVMLMDFIEIVRGAATTDDAVEQAVWLSEAFEKEYVVVRKDVPGFITSRVILPYMLEAAWQLHEGAAALEEIDAAGKFELGFPMGPFELADQTGIDVPVHGVDEGAFKEKYFQIAPNQRQLVEDGDHGKKTGSGWHDWDEGEGCTASPDQADEFDPLPIVAPTVNEAARLVESDVADPNEIDLAMRLGTGYPKGPCRLGDELGLDAIVESLECSPRHDPVNYLLDLVEEGNTGRHSGQGFFEYDTATTDFFTIELARESETGIAIIWLDRQERQNSLNQEMFDELERAFEIIADDDDVRCVIIRGRGDAFCAGADISMLSGMEPYEFLNTSMGEVFADLEQLPKPTIAAIDGYCLGGGLELALACDFRLATKGSTLGLTEITLGLLPGAGGTQRLTRIIGLAKAKEMIMLGEQINASEAADLHLLNEVVNADDLDSTVESLAMRLADGAPIAQQAAKIALHQSADIPIEAGLTLEQSIVAMLFGTDDLDEGIQAFFSDREPRFSGT